MGYDFQRDLQNDAAKKNYDAAMNGEEPRKGVHMYQKPNLWDEERPCDIKDVPSAWFVPTPTISTGSGFSSYSLWKKIAIIIGVVVVVALVAVCAVTYFMDGGGKYMGLGKSFW